MDPRPWDATPKHTGFREREARLSPRQLALRSYLPAAGVVAGAVAIIAVAWFLTPGPAADPRASWTPAPGVTPTNAAEYRHESDPAAVGLPDAPAAVVVFTDYYLCADCTRFETIVAPELEQYVDDGILRLEYRDVALGGDTSQRAAQAAYAASQQDAYTEYRHELLRTQLSADDLSWNALTDIADRLGLDTGEFRHDMRSREAEAVIAANAEQLNDAGLNVAPSFVADGVEIGGYQSPEVFTDWLDQWTELQAATNEGTDQ